MIRERAAQLRGIANEGAAGFERRVQPFVRIDSNRIGRTQRVQPAGAPGALAASAPYAPSTWNQSPCSRQIARDLRERIDRSRADRPAVAAP